MTRLRAYDAVSSGQLVDDLADVYRASWPLDNPFRSRSAFLDRYAGHCQAAGFRLIAAHDGETLIGYIYGYPIPVNTRRWESLLIPLPREYAQETGKRTLGINELHVVATHRREGIARALHDEYIRDQGVERITLLVDPANSVARAAYRSWGYATVGQSQPFPNSPIFDVLVRQIPTG